jgi:hypothetical protein
MSMRPALRRAREKQYCVETIAPIDWCNRIAGAKPFRENSYGQGERE